MAQSAITVTPPNPTPPTNYGAGIANTGLSGSTMPPRPALADAVYGVASGDPWHPGTAPNTLAPYLDDGIANAYPGSINEAASPPSAVVFAAPNSGTAAEGAGTETLVTATYSAAVLVAGSGATYTPAGTPTWSAGMPGGPTRTVGSGPGLTVNVMPTPNGSHASSLSPLTNPTLTTATPGNTTAGAGNTTLAIVGTNLTPQSVVYYNGVAYPTVWNSATSLSVAAVPKKATAGAIPVYVITGGAVVTATVSATYV